MFADINNNIGYELVLALGAFLLSMFITPIYTNFAYKHKLWKKQKSVAITGEKLQYMNKAHAEKIKRHFPTMAGVIILVAVIVVTTICCLNRGQTWLPLAAFVGGGMIGLIDDVLNLYGKNAVAGMRAPVKFAMISALGVFLGWFFACKLGWTAINVPYVGLVEVGVIGTILLFAFAVVATGNAVNITDGMDGLAGGLAMLAYGSYGVIALLQEQWYLAGFCFIVIGALLSYIWFNVYPARFMMGDTGSFALGAGLGVVAMMTNSFLLLPVIGGLFVVEAGSSLLQIGAKKFFHRKIFLSAPIHHHLQAKGWEESKIVMRFWIIGGVLAMLGVFLAMGGGVIR
ncbi:phospho-N-acetylmuramoyl-pentapeptide-transferase [Candidatus Saccharibacteria bacterium]|nr:phospho-N-acetylmuramoyl-pentapeptide-transferase [Candidatus Saccharibacteria bacterium]